MQVNKDKKRNHIQIHYRGPSVLHDEDSGIIQAFRNTYNRTLLTVSALNVLKLPPGGPWNISAFGLKVFSGSEMICPALGLKPRSPPSVILTCLCTRSIQTWAKLCRVRDPDSTLSTTPEIQLGILKRNPLKPLRTC